MLNMQVEKRLNHDMVERGTLWLSLHSIGHRF